MRYTKFLQFICCIVLMGITNYAQAAIYHVKPVATGTGDGTTVANAMGNQAFATKLKDAVAGDVFNLGAGTYKPAYRSDGTTPTNASQWRQATFYIKVGVTINGGVGVILSGDVNTAGTATDNVYHVVTIANSLISTSAYTLDNITIQDGYGNGGSTNSQGAGVFVGQSAQVKFNKITVQNNQTNGHGCGMFVNTGAKVTFDGANSFLTNTYISGDVWGGGLSLWDGATCTFTNSATFTGNTANHGGGLHLYRAKVSIPTATFTSNKAISGHGGAVDSYYYSDLKITTSANISNNTSGSWGGGIHNDYYSTMDLTAATFGTNTALHGGGFHSTDHCTTTLRNCVFTGNKATAGHGGAIDNYATSTLNLFNCTITNNTSSTWGGGIHNDYYSTMSVTSTTFLSNTADHGGGFHNTDHSKAVFRDCMFDLNTATSGHGGAIDNYATSSLTMYNCEIVNNKALASWGGGIHNDASATLLFRTGKITENSAAHGGGIHNTSSTANLYNVEIIQNNATVHGGGINHWGGTMSVDSCTISANSVVGYGGGVHVESGQFNMRRSVVDNNSATINGGGLYIIAPTYIANSTISGNSAGSYGGGMGIGAATTLINNTIVKNTTSRTTNGYGAGLYIGVYPTMTNNLISGNTRSGSVENNLSRANLNNNAKNNIIGSSFYPVNSLVPQPNTVFTIGSHLASLANNAPGVTATHALIGTNNPATTLGNSSVFSNSDGSLKFDQRGVTRKSPSIGAYEALATNNDFIAYDDYVTITSTDPFTFNAIANDYINVDCEAMILHVVSNNATQGTASEVIFGQIGYTPFANFVYDEVEYYLECPHYGTVSNKAKLHIKIKNFPDNIVEAGCTGDAPSTAWGIKESLPTYTGHKIHNYLPLVVGDVDGDGNVEIITGVADTRSVTTLVGNSYPTKGLELFTYNGTSIVHKKTIMFEDNLDVGTLGAVAIARHNDKGYIVIVGMDSLLYAYSPVGAGELHWKSTVKVHGHAAPAGIADFNNDGIPEVYVGNNIFAIETGKLLCSGGVNNNGSFGGHTYMTIAADVVGNDGRMELCAGTQIYDVKIKSYTDVSQNSMTVLTAYQLPNIALPTGANKDGITQVVDIDLDGTLDIVVSSRGTKTVVYAWKLGNGTSALIGSYALPALTYMSMPMIGDIDGDKYPEISFVSNNPTDLYAVKYNPSTAMGSHLEEKWKIAHTDVSGVTGMSLFDFNQDRKFEIVYRDQTDLRIIDGTDATTASVNKAVFPGIISGTLREHPIVADLDGDGTAEIVVSGGIVAPVPGVTDGDRQNGYLRVFKADGSAWAPSRKVWNQYAYNAVNVNNDLTIPRMQYNPATVFPGPDGILGGAGAADDVRPYNGFLMQQTTLSENGIPLWPLPNAQWNTDPTYKYYAEGDSLVITANIKNIGDAGLNGICVTAYKNEVSTANKLVTGCYTKPINPGANATFTFRLINASTYITPGFDYLVLRLNDDGITFPAQAVCDMVGSEFIQPLLAIPMAQNDRTTVFRNSTTNINVLANDNLGTCSTLEPVIITQAKHGNALVGGQQITYTPNPSYIGNDTVKYQITCGADVSEAYVYITVVAYPDNIIDATCYVTPEAQIWNIAEATVSNVFTFLYQTPMVGDIDDDGIPEIVAISSTKKDLIIYKGNDLTTSRTFPTSELRAWAGNAIGLVKTKINNTQSKTLIIVFTTTFKFEAYDAAGVLQWTTPLNVCSGTSLFGFADFNGDGYAEIYANNKVYDAATGKLLCSGTGNAGLSPMFGTTNMYQVAVGDVLGNGSLQLIAGNEVYEVKINSRTDASLNSMTVVKTLPAFTMEDGVTEAPADGATALLDLDLDGNLDVLVVKSTPVTNSQMHLYVWSPTLNKVIAKKTVENVAKRGIPFIGDIDGDGYPEVLMITGSQSNDVGTSDDYIRAFAYSLGSDVLSEKWKMDHSDKSGATGLTLFDFNQDGVSEIVYRDETKLRIINGSGSTPIDMLATPISVVSGTHTEMPVVADIDGDGHAEIITSGPMSGSFPLENGPLRVFKGVANNPWAPSRPVWNQPVYNAVSVNNDLSIPQYQMNPAMVFPGVDGVLGTPDDVRPYNAFLQQQTTLGKDGTPVFTTPDFALQAGHTVTSSAQSANIHFCIKNEGSITGSSPIYVSVYKNTIATANLVATQPFDNVPSVGSIECYDLSITNHGSYSADKLVLVINDKGDASWQQPECDYTNNTVEIDWTKLPIARPDKASTMACETIGIDHLANDYLPTGTIVTVIKNPTQGTFTDIETKVKYTDATPCSPFKLDTIGYKLCNGTFCSETNIVINIVPKPNIELHDACSFKPILKLDYQYQGATYKWSQSIDNGANWTLKQSGAKPELLVTQSGLYKVEITWGTQVITVTVDFKIISSATIAGSTWYETQLN